MGGTPSSTNLIKIPSATVLLFADDIITSSGNISDIQCNFFPCWNNAETKKSTRDLCRELRSDLDQTTCEDEKDSDISLSPSAGIKPVTNKSLGDTSSYVSIDSKAEVIDVIKKNDLVDDEKEENWNKLEKMEDKKISKKFVDIDDKLSNMTKSIKCGYETETSILSESSSSDESLLESMDEEHVIDYGVAHYDSDFSFGDISAEDKKIRARFKDRKKQLRDMIPRRDSSCRKYMMKQEKYVHNQAQNVQKWKRKQRQKIISRKKETKIEDLKSSTNDSLNCALNTENEYPPETVSTTESNDQEVSQNTDDMMDLTILRRKLIPRITSQLLFEWYHTLAAFGCLILYCIFHTAASHLVSITVAEIFVDSALSQYYSILFIALFLMRITGGCYNWGADSSFNLVKFDIHNKFRLGDLDAAILHWFSKRKAFRFFLEVLAFYLCFCAVDTIVSDYVLESLFDKRQEILSQLPSRHNDSVTTYTFSVLNLGFESFDISYDRHMLIRAAKEKVSYDDIMSETQCLLLGYVDMDKSVSLMNGNAMDDDEEDSEDDDDDDDDNEEDSEDDDDDDEEDSEDDEEDAKGKEDVCVIKDDNEEGSNTESKRNYNTTCEAVSKAYVHLKDEQQEESINDFIMKQPYYDEIASDSLLLSEFFLSSKEFDDDWYFYNRVSKSSYFAIMGNPDAPAVDLKSSFFFYIMCLTLTTLAIYKLDIFYLII